jgi:hypothetical protein
VKQRVKDLETKKVAEEKQLAQQAVNKVLERTKDKPDETKNNQSANKKATKKDENVRQVSGLEQRINNQEQGLVRAVDPNDYKVQEQQYQYVHQLPFSIRKDLPKFKLNVHIFDKDPENRVAIINGVRFYIDDMIEETVLLKDIVQQGVLLDFNGEEFLVPR